MLKQFYFEQFSLAPDRVNLEAKATKGYSAFLKAPALLEPHHQII